VGVGVPIPVLDEEIAGFCAVKDEDIVTQVVDYSSAYPEGKRDVLGEVTYKELRSGRIRLGRKEVPTGGLSSYAKARAIAEILKGWIQKGEFLLTEPVLPIAGPESGVRFKPMRTGRVER